MLFLPGLFYVILLITYLMIYSKRAYIINEIINPKHLSKDTNQASSLNQEEKQPMSLNKTHGHKPVPPHIHQRNQPVPPHEHQGHQPIPPHKHLEHHSFIGPNNSDIRNSKPQDTSALPIKNKQKLQTILLFFLLIIGISIAPFINISISIIVMICGSILLFLDNKKPEDAINTLPILDALVFISTLFFIGTILKISGLLSMAVDNIISYSGSNNYIIVLIIILSAFIIATFLSAGPAAATLLPICSQLTGLVDYRIIYTALALGILARSSMLPWSATGGPIMLGEVNRFLKQKNISKTMEKEVLCIFKLKNYLSFSIPFSLIILFCSILYLLIYIALSL